MHALLRVDVLAVLVVAAAPGRVREHQGRGPVDVERRQLLQAVPLHDVDAAQPLEAPHVRYVVREHARPLDIQLNTHNAREPPREGDAVAADARRRIHNTRDAVELGRLREFCGADFIRRAVGALLVDLQQVALGHVPKQVVDALSPFNVAERRRGPGDVKVSLRPVAAPPRRRDERPAIPRVFLPLKPPTQ